MSCQRRMLPEANWIDISRGTAVVVQSWYYLRFSARGRMVSSSASSSADSSNRSWTMTTGDALSRNSWLTANFVGDSVSWASRR